MVNEFNESNLVSLTELTEISTHHWFEMKFSSGVILKARVHEENVVSLFYNNRCIYSSLGKEMCIALDIALAASGCEAIEGFYSVTAAHKMNGGQGNNVLVQRAIVDWCIPNPISCPNTMAEIAYSTLKEIRNLVWQDIDCLCTVMSVSEQHKDMMSVK